MSRERDAIELLDRIYSRKSGHQLSDAGMFQEWVDEEIAAFIRKYGALPDLVRLGRSEDAAPGSGGAA